MLHFIDTDRKPPETREVKLRAEDFREIYNEFTNAAAAEQSGRCSQCGVPFCQVHCPLGNNIPDWLKAAAEGRLREAYEISQATNTMPEICGRICPQDVLCEGSCVVQQSGHGTVTIGAVERFLTETAWTEGWVKPIKPATPTGQSIGIIGAGPAGLTAAELMRERGHDVVIYDRYDRAGGLLTYGIPNFKLEASVVDRRIKRLHEAGIALQLKTEIGDDVTFSELRDRHEAVFIGTGVYKFRALDVSGSDLDGVHAALDYLTTSNRKTYGDAVPEYQDGTLNASGKRVVVIGGGDTAMDCVRTAIRQGAKSVTCLYRRDRANMPGSLREVSHAEEEGVYFDWLAAPVELGGTKSVSKVRAIRMRLGAAAPGERQRIEEVPNTEYEIDADMVILALGFDPENLPKMFHEPLLGISRWGTLAVDPVNSMTSLPGVFAGGDIVRGASLAVWAIRDGREATRHMDSYLNTLKSNAKVAS